MAESKIYSLTRSAGSSLSRVRQVTPILKGEVAYPLYIDGFSGAVALMSEGDLYEVAIINEDTGEVEGTGEIRAVTAAEVAKAELLAKNARLEEMLKKYEEAKAETEEALAVAEEAQSICEEAATEAGLDPEVACASEIATVNELADEADQISEAISAIKDALGDGEKSK